MLDKFRTQKIIWDKANNEIFEKVEAHSGDSNGRKLTVQVLNNGMIENLTDCTLSLAWQTKDMEHFGLDAFTAVDIEHGIFEIYYTRGMLSNVGELRASFVLMDSKGRIESKGFTIEVLKSNVDDDAVQSDNSFTALTEALIKVSKYQDVETEIQQARVNADNTVTYDTLKDRLDTEHTEVKSQLAQTEQELNAQLADKLNKGEVSVSDIDKNKGKLDQTYMADEFLQQMAGTTPINTVPANRSLTSIKFADKSVLPSQVAFIETSSNLHDKKKDTLGFIISSDGTIIANVDYAYSDYILVNPNTLYSTRGLYFVAEYDENKNFIKRITVDTAGGSFTTSVGTYYVRLDYQPVVTSYGLPQLNLGDLVEYEEYYEKILSSVGTESLEDESVTSEKRTVIGNVAIILSGSPFKLPNFDMINHKLQLFGQTIVSWNNKRYTISNDSSTITEIDFSSVWNNGDLLPLIFFNTKTLEFKVYSSLEYQNITEDSVFICAVNKNGKTGDLLGIVCNFDYTLNGELKNELSYYIPSSIPDGWYDAPADTLGYNLEWSHWFDVSFQDIYARYDALVTNNGDWVTKTNLGLDASSQHSIYSYTFNPPDIIPSVLTKTKPKFIVVTNLHGDEKQSVVSLINFMEDIANNWRGNSLLEFLRWNVEFIVIPIANPYGYVNSTRQNANGVDLARNFPYAWESYIDEGVGGRDYKGTTPLSEPEAQYIANIINVNKDTVAFFDYHTNGTSGDVYNTMYWHIPEHISEIATRGFKETNVVARTSILKITNESQKKYSIPTDSGLIGYITHNTERPTPSRYAMAEGIPSIVVECSRKAPLETLYWSSNIMKMNTEFVGNLFLNTLREFMK